MHRKWPGGHAAFRSTLKVRYLSSFGDLASTFNYAPEFKKVKRYLTVLCGRACVLGGIMLGSSVAGVSGQPASAAGALLAGDSVRVNGAIGGRVLSVEGNTFTLLSRGKPVCRAGEMHGEAPICDPAPIQRRTLLFEEVSLERRMEKGNPAMWTLGGGVIGGGVFAALGYFIGPVVGFGKVPGCTAQESNTYCVNPISKSELDAQQKVRDQRRGAFFFGVVGGTFAAVMARKLSVGWVEFTPTAPLRSNEGWGMSVTVPEN